MTAARKNADTAYTLGLLASQTHQRIGQFISNVLSTATSDYPAVSPDDLFYMDDATLLDRANHYIAHVTDPNRSP